MKVVIFCFLLLGSVVAQDTERRLVNTAQGPVYGYKDQEFDIFVFYEIPYATAPTGTQRFKPPLPPPKWIDPFEAKFRGVMCPQAIDWGLKRQEDCLVTSIYVPANQVTKLPVVVYVHGGGFTSAYGNFWTPKNLAHSQNVIIVTFNYRLGAHGFLCLGTKDAPGNAGMKDQVALLRWVNRNIEHFGGDPNDVTIAGYSAGAASVDLLSISKITKGLFKKVSTESGAHLSPFAIQVDPIYTAKEYAKKINFTDVENIKDIHELEEFFKTIPFERLNTADDVSKDNFATSMIPCIEREIEGEESFLTQSPYTILKSGENEKFPLLYGFTNMEGLLHISVFDEWMVQMNANFSMFLPLDLQFESELQRDNVARRVKEFYFSNNPVSPENVLRYVDFYSDIFFTYPMLRSVRLQVENGHNQIYLYEYSFVDENTPYVPYTNVRGADHSTQTMMVLDHDMTNITEAHLNMTNTMRNIWLNFMITGQPIPENSDLPYWPPVNLNSSPYMALSQNLSLGDLLLPDRTALWDDIYGKYYREPQPPPAPSKGFHSIVSNLYVISCIFLSFLA